MRFNSSCCSILAYTLTNRIASITWLRFLPSMLKHLASWFYSASSSMDANNPIWSHQAQPKALDNGHPETIKNFVLFDPELDDPSSQDLKQGRIGNCFAIQTLSAIAFARPDVIKDNIRIDDLEKGYFSVKLYNEARKPVYVSVDMTTVKQEGQSNGRVQLRTIESGDIIVWPLIYEKALAKFLDWQTVRKMKAALKVTPHVAKGEGYERMQHGGSSRAIMEITTGADAGSFTFDAESSLFLLWLLGRYAEGIDQMSLGERLPVILGSPSFKDTAENDHKLAKHFRNLHNQPGFGCYRDSHAHPMHGFDYRTGIGNLWCDLYGGYVAPLPWFQLKSIMKYVRTTCPAITKLLLRKSKLREFAQEMLIDPTSQPKMITVGEWVELQDPDDDFTRIAPTSDPICWKPQEAFIEIVHQVCPYECLQNRIQRTGNNIYELNLNWIKNSRDGRVLLKHQRPLRVMVDSKIQKRSRFFPIGIPYINPKHLDPGTAWSLAFRKGLVKAIE